MQRTEQSGPAIDSDLIPTNIIERLDAIAIGQAQYKEALAAEVFIHRHRRDRARMGHANAELGPRQNVLCAGPTGTGKTHIAEHAGKDSGIPFIVKDASRLTPTGITGMNVASIASDALYACGDDLEQAQWAMVFLDEADKLRERWAVQFELLRFVEGTTIALRVRGKRVLFDTSNMLFVAAGAFDGIVEIVEDRTGRLDRPSALQHGEPETVGQLLSATGSFERCTEAFARSIPEDFARYGLKAELIARFATRVVLHELGPAALMRILLESYSPLAHLGALCRDFGVAVHATDAARWAVAERAAALHQGARGLQAVLEPLRRRIVLELPGLRERGLCRVRLDAEQIETGCPMFEEAEAIGSRLDLSRHAATPCGDARGRAERAAALFRPGTLPERPSRSAGARLARYSDIEDLMTPTEVAQ